MEGWQVALLVLAAVFVGALLPLLAQLYGTLRTLRSVMDKSAKDIEAAMVAIHHTSQRLDRLGAALEKDGKINEIVDGLTNAAHLVNQMRGTMQIAGNVSAAVVPAVIAAVRAWKGEMSEDPSRAASAEPAAPESSTQQRKEASG
jgi:hypothetical protein